MALTKEEIAVIYSKKRAPAQPRAAQGLNGKRKLSRKHVHWPTLPPNHLVYYIAGYSIPCDTCGAPASKRMRGQPICDMHLVFSLVHEVNLLSHNGQVDYKTGGVAPEATDAAATPPVIDSDTSLMKELEIVSDSYL